MRIFVLLLFICSSLHAEVYHGRLPNRPPPELSCRSSVQGAKCEAKYVFPSKPRWFVQNEQVRGEVVAYLPLSSEWTVIGYEVDREDGVWLLEVEARWRNNKAEFRRKGVPHARST